VLLRVVRMARGDYQSSCGREVDFLGFGGTGTSNVVSCIDRSLLTQGFDRNPRNKFVEVPDGSACATSRIQINSDPMPYTNT